MSDTCGRCKHTEEEMKVVMLAEELANAYAALPSEHPSELAEVCDAIHRIQGLLTMRIARRAEPDVYPVKGEDDG
ncbi:MAG: hypothetical protein A2W26_04965 [Acidobacteria bacterium RBG_16_64_8]|nr:MAG: hypothetical protein A2W26_04965 [Acidobacteria bacterium RBG_16_64_8]